MHICIVEETPKEAKEGVSSSCNSIPLITPHLCVHVDEVQPVTSSAEYKSKTERPVENTEMELTEVVDRGGLNSIVNIEDEITAAPWPSELDDLPSRKMKRTNLFDCSTKLRKCPTCLVVVTLTACALLVVLALPIFHLLRGE